MSFDLYIDVEKLGGGGDKLELDYSVSSGPFLTMNFEFNQDHGPRPGPELDNFYTHHYTYLVQVTSELCTATPVPVL